MEYDAEYEEHRQADRRQKNREEGMQRQGEDGYEIEQSTAYDPEFDRAMRFEAGEWGELLEPNEGEVDPVEVLPQDVILSRNVSERLEAEPRLDFSRVGVYCEAGVVTLRGQVASDEERRIAVDVVSSTPSVVGLSDELEVRGK